MAIVVSKSHKWRVLAAHVFLIGFILLMLFPLIMVVVISLRPGNAAGGARFGAGLSPEPDSQPHNKE